MEVETLQQALENEREGARRREEGERRVEEVELEATRAVRFFPLLPSFSDFPRGREKGC